MNQTRALAVLGIESAHVFPRWHEACTEIEKMLHVDSTKMTRELCKVYTWKWPTPHVAFLTFQNRNQGIRRGTDFRNHDTG
ncbi:MAG: hypothetical protein IKO73_02055 [Bacteroidaceae bacterium]|nr:hypothetical protein [Bacteroidaceae bacterium]